MLVMVTNTWGIFVTLCCFTGVLLTPSKPVLCRNLWSVHMKTSSGLRLRHLRSRKQQKVLWVIVAFTVINQAGKRNHNHECFNLVFFQQLYITCNLRASTTEQAIDEGHRACSYENNRWVCYCVWKDRIDFWLYRHHVSVFPCRWVEASGAHGACDSCPVPSGVSYTGGSSATGSGVSYSPGFGQQKTKQQRNQGQRQGRYRRDLVAGTTTNIELFMMFWKENMTKLLSL